MIKVIFKGVLEKKFGKELNFMCRNINEVMRAIESNRKSFRKFIFKLERELGQVFCVLKNGVKTDYEDWNKKLEHGDEIVLMPVVCGASFSKIFGAILVVVGIVVAYAFGWTGFGAAVGFALVSAGLSMLLTPTPKIQPQQQNTSAGLNSYLFGGRLNNARQGGPVPLGYGRLKIGSIVVSANIAPQNLANTISFNARLRAFYYDVTPNLYTLNEDGVYGLPSETKVLRRYASGTRFGVPVLTCYLLLSESGDGSYEKYNPSGPYKMYVLDATGSFVLLSEVECMKNYLYLYRGRNAPGL